MGTGCLLGRDPDIAEDGVRPVGEYFNSLLGKLPQMQSIPTTSAAANLAQPSNMTRITGPTFASLMQAIEEFPTTYPNYRENPPKLDNDVRPWLVEQFGCNVREKHVFGQIIAEHFDLQ